MKKLIFISLFVVVPHLGCKARYSSTLQNGPQISSEPDSNHFYIALGKEQIEADEYEMMIAPTTEIEADSLRVCIGSKDDCSLETAKWIETFEKGQVSGRTFFVAKDLGKFTQDRKITIKAKAAGASADTKELMQTFALRKRGASTADSEEVSVTGDCYKVDKDICKIETEITRLTSEYRQGRDLNVLRHHAKLAFVARLWSIEQGKLRDISHTGFPKVRQQDYVKEFKSLGKVSMTGENVAMADINSGTPEAIAKKFAVMWWNSAGHKANMLKTNHMILGVGVAKVDGKYYATQIFGKD
jgi:uncharacterized protein YkwD